ncbi:DUF6684 family protein [Halopiger thermotolerans]
MLEWLSRETAIDASINAVPVVILAYFAVFFEIAETWSFDPLTVVLTHTLTLLPLVLLIVATYVVARVIERDADRS